MENTLRQSIWTDWKKEEEEERSEGREEDEEEEDDDNNKEVGGGAAGAAAVTAVGWELTLVKGLSRYFLWLQGYLFKFADS